MAMNPIIEALLQASLADVNSQISIFDAQIAQMDSDYALIRSTRSIAIEKRDALMASLPEPEEPLP